MELAEPLRPVLALLQRTYPDGVPQQDFRALLVVLGDLLCEGNLALVVAEFIDGEMVVVDNDAAAAHSINPPGPRDRARGVRLGRPQAMTAEQIRHARDLLTRPDNTVSSIARLLGVSRASIYKYIPEIPARTQPAAGTLPFSAEDSLP